MFLRFAINSYESPALSLSAQRVVNARTVKGQQGARTQTPVFRCPGIKAFQTLPAPIRGANLAGDRLVVVAGETAYGVSSGGTSTAMGAIPGTGHCASAAGTGKAVFLSSGNGYVVTSTVTPITDPDYLPSTHVTWSDGYFVFLAADRVFTCELNDPTALDALAFDTLIWAIQNPNAILADTRDLIHFMPKAMAIGYNKGTRPYPFALSPDGFIERGCLAPRSLAKLDNTVFWLADDLTVRALRGVTPTRITTEPLEQLFATFETLDDAYGMAISQGGCFSYVLTFPTEGRTFEYNVATELWNERASYGADKWQVEGHIEAYGKHFVWAGNKLGILDTETYAEWGEPQPVVLTSEPMHNGVNYVHFDRLEIDADMGNGLITGQGSDPQIILRYSDDGGKTWSSDFQRSMGKMGETKRRAVFTRHGRSRNRVYQLVYSDPTAFAFYGVWVNEEGAIAA
jgi:hypothetical protein